MRYDEALSYLKTNSIKRQEEGTEIIFKMAADTLEGNLDPFLLKDIKKMSKLQLKRHLKKPQYQIFLT